MRPLLILAGFALLLPACLTDDGGDSQPTRDLGISGGAGGGMGGAGGGMGGQGGQGGATGEGCQRTFVYWQGDASPAAVRLAGAFEQPPWAGAIALGDDDGDGFWTATVVLDPGAYQYKFIVDDTWIADPLNPLRTEDGEGGWNSVVEHSCPYLPTCLRDADCPEATPLCRNDQCLAAEPCLCEGDQVCNDDGVCVAPPQCDADRPCDAPEVCRDGACAPECTEDAHCAGEALCVDLACVAPECETFADCEAGESCVDLQCVERACGDITFTYDPQGTAYDQVYVAGAFTDWEAGAVAMEWLEGEGHWHTRLQIDNGAHQYKFILETGGARDWITDPSNPDTAPDGFGGNNSVLTVACDDPGPGPSACGDVEAFDWRDAVMYFAMVDRFHDGDGQRDPVHGVTDGPGDGSSGQYMGGDLPGLTAKIPYLQSLGVTAIWITAPYENRDIAGAAIDPNGDPHTYSGYHGYWPSPDDVDYSDLDNPQPRPRVESRIGTDADLHAFVDAAHAAGIKVLFDYVMNHVDVESGLYRAHSDPANGNDWFARRDGNFALCGPDNLWDDPFWGTRCAFTSYLPPFDFDNAAARAWSINDAVWWAKEYDIDGYRLDAIKHVSLQWLQELRGALSAQFPEPAGDRFYLVGETFAYDDQNLIRSFVDPDTMLDGQFDFPFKARVCEAVLQPGGRLDNFAGWMGGNDTFYGPGALMTTWIGNHDIPRAIHFASGQIGNCREGSSTGNGWAAASFPQPNDALAYERMALVYAIMMTNPGIPLIYYGDEVGLGGGGDPDNRRMMPWDDNALNAHQHALRAKVAKLGQIRTAHPVLGRGTRTNLQQDHDQGRFWVYRMRGCGDASPDITVAINKSDGPVTVDIPQGAYVDLMNDAAVQGGQMQLEARDFVVLQAAE